MFKLYSFYLDFSRMGALEGLFIATDEALNKIKGKHIHFGEVLGKHSDVYIDNFSLETLEVLNEEQDFLNKLWDVIGGSSEDEPYLTISGYNPLDYYDPEEDFEYDEENNWDENEEEEDI